MGGIGIAAIVALAIYNDGTTTDADSGKQRPDTVDGRRKFAEIMRNSMKTTADGVYTEGARAQGLVFDMSDCTDRTLSDLVQRHEIADRLWQFDFEYVRCTNGVRVQGPWAGHDE